MQGRGQGAGRDADGGAQACDTEGIGAVLGLGAWAGTRPSPAFAVALTKETRDQASGGHSGKGRDMARGTARGRVRRVHRCAQPRSVFLNTNCG